MTAAKAREGFMAVTPDGINPGKSSGGRRAAAPVHTVSYAIVRPWFFSGNVRIALAGRRGDRVEHRRRRHADGRLADAAPDGRPTA